MGDVQIGVIGGSGMYEIEGLTDIDSRLPETPFGPPSDEIVTGTLRGVRIAFLPRHGRGHVLSPSELPSQANIWALKMLGVQYILSISAVGSLRAELEPRHIVIPDQLIDRTKGIRPPSFFGDGIVAHVAFAEPYCPELRHIVYVATEEEMGNAAHDGGTLVVMEGPVPRVPSHALQADRRRPHRHDGLPEPSSLAKRHVLLHSGVVTDYDSWHDSDRQWRWWSTTCRRMSRTPGHYRSQCAAYRRKRTACSCQDALRNAIITHGQHPRGAQEMLRPLIGPYL